MKITWYGTATIAVEDENTKIIFDPFVRQNKKLRSTPVEGFTGFDAIFITHGHFDHLFSIPDIMNADRNVPVYCTKTPAATLCKHKVNMDNVKVIEHGDTLQIGEFKITAYRAKHIVFDAKYILSVFMNCAIKLPVFISEIYHHINFPENEEILMYEIEHRGKRVLLSGSFGVVDGIEYPKKPDMFILAHGGSTKIEEVVTPFVDEIQPASIMFTHFDDAFPPLTRYIDVEKVSRDFRKTHPDIKFIIPKELVPFEL